MTKKFKNLILTKDMKFDDSIEVEKTIKCKDARWNLTVVGNIVARDIVVWDIDAGDIDARNIDAGDIDAGDITAWDIDARNIDVWNIDAWDIDAKNIDAWNIDARNIAAGNIDAGNIIFCEKINRKKIIDKIKCRILVENRSKLKIKEWKLR